MNQESNAVSAQTDPAAAVNPVSAPIAQPLMKAAAYRHQDPRTKSPFLAAFLSLIPGLGQIYVGYYRRGFVNPFVVGGVLSILVFFGQGSEPPFFFPLGILFLIFFWLYNLIDAWRRATLYNLALEGVENIELPDDGPGPGIGGSLFGGAMLLIVGVVTLAYTKFGMPIEVLEEWWPLVPIAFGAYLMYRAYQDKQG